MFSFLPTAKDYCKVIFPYEAQNDDELTIKEGDIVTLINKVNKGSPLPSKLCTALRYWMDRTSFVLALETPGSWSWAHQEDSCVFLLIRQSQVYPGEWMNLKIQWILFALEPAVDLHGSAENICPSRANPEGSLLGWRAQTARQPWLRSSGSWCI